MYENILLPLFIICIVTLMYCGREIMKYKNPSIVQQEYIQWQQDKKKREDRVGCFDCDYYMMHVFGGHYHEDCLLSEPLHNPDCTKYKWGEVLIAPWNKGPENENMKEGYDEIKNFFEKI